MCEHKIWIDTDTGIDDAIALLTAVKLADLEVVGVSAVCGNVEHEKTFRNARNVLSLAGREDIPVYPGAIKPLLKELRPAAYFHGNNGLGGAEIPDSKAPWETKKAHEALYEKAKELNGELELVAVGPLTNVATAIVAHPDIVKYLKRILIMGGAVVGGNITPCAEFNIFTDPQAAETVFKCGVPIVMCGLDVTTKACLSYTDIDEIAAYNNPAAKLLDESTRNVREYNIRDGHRSIHLHDSCPIFYLAFPEYFTAYPCGVYVETQGTITMGKTVCDLYTDHKFEDRHVTVVMDLDNDSVVRTMKDIYQLY